MATTLREHRQIRKDAEVVRERLDDHRAQLLLETMNQQDLATATKIIQKLRNMKGKGLESLDHAISLVEDEINQYTSGGTLAKGWRKLKSIVGAKNPLVKAMTTANMIETLLGQLPQILSNGIEGFDDPAKREEYKDKKISDIVTDPERFKTLEKNIARAVKPQGLFSRFSGYGMNQEAIVADIMNAVTLDALQGLININKTGPKSTEMGNEMQQQAGGEGQGTAEAQPAAGTAGADMSIPGGKPAAGVAKTGEEAPTKPGEGRYTAGKEYPGDVPDATIDRWADEVSSTLTDVTPEQFKKVLQVLNHAGKLKEAIRRGHVVRIIKGVQGRLQDLEES